MPRLLIVSLDAVADNYFSQLAARPNFGAFAKKAAVYRAVSTVHLSNTYPVHTSVATGVLPGVHGLISNTAPFPSLHPQWCYLEKDIKAQTLWQAAAKKGLCTAAVMWPVTAGAKSIKYNIPELLKQPQENQLLLNLKHGSKLLQIKQFLRHGHLLCGVQQPQLDSFTTACMADILRQKKPDFALVHLTAYDSLCHIHGIESPQLAAAYSSLDENLGTLLKAFGTGDVIVFSDHAQLPAQNPILPNQMLATAGHLPQNAQGEYVQNGKNPCFFECVGGSGFLHPGALLQKDIDNFKHQCTLLDGFNRFLSPEEMRQCGRANLPFGFAAKPGYSICAYAGGEKANHGYPPNYPNYKVFYLHKGQGAAAKSQDGGSLLDIAPLAANILGLNFGQK